MTQRTRAHRIRSAVAVVAALVALLCGCGAFDNGARFLDPEAEDLVAADPDATASEIIEAGGPTGIAVSDDVTLVSWSATTDTTEGPQQGAWRLYDGDGQRIADGTLGQVFDAAATPTLAAVPDGFVLTDYTGPGFHHLDLDGTLTDVPASRTRTPTRPGDVLVPSFYTGRSLVYRPSKHRVYRLPLLPFPRFQRVALDRTGRLWVQQLWGDRRAPVSSSADGSGPWTRTEVPLPVGGQPQSLVVVRGQVVMSTAVATGSEPALHALWTRPVSGSPSAAWRKIDAAGVRLRDLDPLIGALADGRLVVGGANQQTYVAGDDGGFSRLRPPDGLRSSTLAATAKGLYLLEAPDNQLYRSADGTAWERVRR